MANFTARKATAKSANPTTIGHGFSGGPLAETQARDGSEIEVALGQLLVDGAAQDLVGAVGDVDHAQGVVGVDQADLVGQAHAAVGLDGAVDRAQADLDGVGLTNEVGLVHAYDTLRVINIADGT